MPSRLLSLFLLLSVAVVSIEGACAPPPSGLWIGSIDEPLLGPIIFKRKSTGYLILKKQDKPSTIYKGWPRSLPSQEEPLTNAGQVHLNSEASGLKFKTLFKLHAFWSQDDCTLRGTLMAEAVGIHDSIMWKFDGENLQGVYVTMLFGKFSLPYTSMHVFEYAGKRSDNDLHPLAALQ